MEITGAAGTADRNAEPGLRDAGRPLRIVHVVSSLAVGGMEQFVLRIAAHQRRAGHEASVLAVRDGPLREAALSQGLPMEVLGGGGKWRWLARSAACLARLRPEVVHAHNTAALPYALAGRLSGRPVVVMTGHGQQPGARLPTALEWQQTAAVVAVSEAAASVLRSACPGHAAKITVIHNGVEPIASTRSREVVRSELGLADRITGIIVARIDGRKGHDTILRALALLPGERRPAVLIVGDGEERPALQRLAGELRVSDQARFLGFRSDVPELLTASDFFLLPSLSEGLPLSLLEAMSHRLPVIATPVGGIPEIMTEPELGLLVPVDDPQALVEAMTALEDPRLRERLGSAAAARVRDAFSFEAMTLRYEQLYRRLCGASR